MRAGTLSADNFLQVHCTRVQVLVRWSRLRIFIRQTDTYEQVCAIPPRSEHSTIVPAPTYKAGDRDAFKTDTLLHYQTSTGTM